MKPVNFVSVLIGKLIVLLSSNLKLGSGSTWPGHVALMFNLNFCKDLLDSTKTRKIIIVGTNGKTTTGKLLRTVIEQNNKTVAHNEAGANLLNGLASTLIKYCDTGGRLNTDYLIFECDEYSLPKVLKTMTPDYIICLDLFRDQLDRYGELDSIAKKWNQAFKNIGSQTTLILNSDDPLIAFLSNETKAKTLYFGLSEKTQTQIKHGADTLFCPRCQAKLSFENVFFSHLGIWNCANCKLKRPSPDISKFDTYPIPGLYNKYNILASVLVLLEEKFSKEQIKKAFKDFTPAFGRQEKISYKGKDIFIFLSKNPTSFNESLSTVKELGAKNVLFVLNDKIPDGLDISWIWDINLEELLDKGLNIAVSGDRVYDMALRIKYSNFFTHIEPNLEHAIGSMLEKAEPEEALYILPNYSAMLDTRKILLGRKLL